VQLLLAEHAAVLLVNTHPFNVSQVSVVQTMLSLQVLGVPTQTPLEHTSFSVQALRSVQAVPSGCPAHDETQLGEIVRTQLPVIVLQESVLHASLSSQFFCVPVQALFLQTSFVVQALLSLQGRVLA